MGEYTLKKLLVVCCASFLGIVTARADTLVLNFAGLAQSSPDDGGLPPETTGSVGPNIYFQTLSSNFQSDAVISGASAGPTLSDAQFWANAGIGSSGAGLSSTDPRFNTVPAQVGNSVYLVPALGLSAGDHGLVDWSMVDATNPNAPMLVSEGQINGVNPGYYYASLAANSSGNFTIAFTRSGPASGGSAGNIASYYQACYLNGQQCDDPSQINQSNITEFTQGFGAGSRWGNFSAAVIDPTDQYHFWTVEEYSVSVDEWGTPIGQVGVAVPEPSTVFLLAAGLFAAWRGRRRRPNR